MSDFKSYLRHKVSKHKRRYIEEDYDLDLSYINDRIIAMGFPSNKVESIYRNDRKEVKKFLDQKHPERYKVFNLCSEKKYDIKFFENRVFEMDIHDHSPCRFCQILPFCKEMEKWLNLNSTNIVVVHCKAGKGRTGMMIVCFLIYFYKMKSQEAINLFDMKRTYNNKGVTIPSQLRYITYFERALNGENPFAFYRKFLKENPEKSFLTYINEIEIYNFKFSYPKTVNFVIEHLGFNSESENKSKKQKFQVDSLTNSAKVSRNKVLPEKRDDDYTSFVIESRSSEETRIDFTDDEKDVSGESESAPKPKTRIERFSLKEKEIPLSSLEEVPCVLQIPNIYDKLASKDRKITYKKEVSDDIVHIFKCRTELRIAPCSDIKITVYHTNKPIFHFVFHSGFIRQNQLRLNKFEIDGDYKFYKDMEHIKVSKKFRAVLKFLSFQSLS